VFRLPALAGLLPSEQKEFNIELVDVRSTRWPCRPTPSRPWGPQSDVRRWTPGTSLRLVSTRVDAVVAGARSTARFVAMARRNGGASIEVLHRWHPILGTSSRMSRPKSSTGHESRSQA
jgi:hypothetical protein